MDITPKFQKMNESKEFHSYGSPTSITVSYIVGKNRIQINTCFPLFSYSGTVQDLKDFAEALLHTIKMLEEEMANDHIQK